MPVNIPPKERLDNVWKHDFIKIANDKESSDVTLVFSGQMFYAHKFMLRIRSDYFKVMFNSGFAETQQCVIELHDDDPAMLRLMLQYIYEDESYRKTFHHSGSLAFGLKHFSQVLPLFTVAEKYQVTSLMDALVLMLCSIFQEGHSATYCDKAFRLLAELPKALVTKWSFDIVETIESGANFFALCRRPGPFDIVTKRHPSLSDLFEKTLASSRRPLIEHCSKCDRHWIPALRTVTDVPAPLCPTCTKKGSRVQGQNASGKPE